MRNSETKQLFGRQSALALFAFFAFALTLFHFFGPAVRGAEKVLPVAFRHGRLPQYWSVTGDSPLEGSRTFEKPANLSVVALVFYGRPSSVSILDCYLKRNLVENGGMIDEVKWIARTKRLKDLAWLDELVESSPSYTRVNVTWKDGDFRSSYDLIQNGTMYIKIDDDVVFIEDTTIPSLIQTKLAHPENYIISANIINQPSLSWVHSHLGVMRPYLPELSPPEDFDRSRIFAPQTYDFTSTHQWRASALPSWTGPPDFNYTSFFLDHPNGAFPGHRWLPVRDKWNNDDTPTETTNYDAFGPALWHWYVGAQQHMSFLEHLERNDLWRYKFGSWDYEYARMGIQFVGMMGEDINRGKPMTSVDDEFYLSEFMPKKTKRHGIVDGRALVAHYSFAPQKEGMGATDILDRYRAFALENICF